MSKNLKTFFLLLLPFLFSLVAFIGCTDKPIKNNNEGKTLLTYKVIKTNFGWGYNILLDNKLYIHQEYIPDIQGYHSFKTIEDAEKTAKLAAQKIKLGILPPTISKKEIDSLKIKYDR